ncbi:MAG: GNAT family N-acetyltransferase [Thaumarchaeota archaeon]|nr:GNAT family N-acetyltransferase [Nitrososphaerota archaeon]
MAPALGPCVLEGNHVRLEPLRPSHARGLFAAAQDSDWTWMSMDPREKEAMDDWIEIALGTEERGLEHPFTVFSRDEHRVLGSTRYMDVRPLHRGVEIGMTWYTSQVWGTAVNPECKFLLLQHAFEDWNAVRVQLKTDGNNVHSQKAILKLGARFEGRLRNHRVRRDGSPGDSMMYSITDGDWRESVKKSLRKRIDDLGIAEA